MLKVAIFIVERLAPLATYVGVYMSKLRFAVIMLWRLWLEAWLVCYFLQMIRVGPHCTIHLGNPLHCS